MTRSAKKVVELMAQVGVPASGEVKIFRTRAGRHQRSAGAWKWFAVDHEGYEILGSGWTIKELCKADKVVLYIHPHNLSKSLEIGD